MPQPEFATFTGVLQLLCKCASRWAEEGTASPPRPSYLAGVALPRRRTSSTAYILFGIAGVTLLLSIARCGNRSIQITIGDLGHLSSIDGAPPCMLTWHGLGW